MSIKTNIVIDFTSEIEEYMSTDDFFNYIKWYFDETDDDVLIKNVKQLLVDDKKIDTLLYDLDLTYKGFIFNVCKLYPNILTPHIIKQIRVYIEEHNLQDEKGYNDWM
jgi:hypothetical protein